MTSFEQDLANTELDWGVAIQSWQEAGTSFRNPTPSMPRQWFIKSKTGSHGPVSSDSLQRMARKGKLTPNMGVSTDGENWMKAKKLAGLSFSSRQDSSNREEKAVEKRANTRWYVRTQRSVAGPFSLRRLNKLAAKGRLLPNVAVSRDQKKWVKAKRILGLEFPDQKQHSNQRESLPVVGELPIFGPLPTLSDLTPVAQPRLCVTLPVINELPIIGPVPSSPVPSISDLSSRVIPRVYIALPVINELPIAGLIPSIDDLPSRIPLRVVTPLPVVNELPFVGPFPTFEDLTVLRDKGVVVPLPVVNELPIDGPFPSIDDLAPRTIPRVRIALPVINELPILGPFPSISDLPPRTQPRVAVPLPVINELPFAGPLPTLNDLAAPRRERVSVPLPVVHELPLLGPLPRLEDFLPRERESVELPVISELPIAGPLPTLDQIGNRPSARVAGAPSDKSRREAEYVNRFGPMLPLQQSVSDTIDVCIHPASDERPFATMVTSGLSDHAMRVPSGAWSPRAELIWYVDQPRESYANTLRSLAQMPIDHKSGLWYGLAVNNGHPATPIFNRSLLNSFLFMVSSIPDDHAIRETVSIDGDPLQLLWVVPITLAERFFLDNNGMQHFCWLLDQHNHSIITQPRRPCFVSGAHSKAM